MVQMPAVNTPQFSWVLSRLPHQAQPVPPIYQPEVAARAVVYAADHPRRREYWVGDDHRRRPSSPTPSRPACSTATSPAPASAPSRPASPSRRTSRRTCGSRPTAPDGRDFGAHGLFDDQAHARSPQVWASQHHGTVYAAALAALAGAAAAWSGRRVGEAGHCGPAGAGSVALAVPGPAARRHRRASTAATPGPGSSSGSSVAGSSPRALADLALGPRTRVPDIVIDVTHAATMVVVADRWPDHRRSAMVSAALATGTAALDLVAQPAP